MGGAGETPSLDDGSCAVTVTISMQYAAASHITRGSLKQGLSFACQPRMACLLEGPSRSGTILMISGSTVSGSWWNR